MKKKSVLISLLVAIALFFAFGMYAYQKRVASSTEQAAGQNANNLIRFYSPTLGGNEATSVLVEFFDPACEACRAFYPVVKKLLNENNGRLKLVLRYAPFHKDSDKVVKILEASKRQGLYWQSLEAALESQPVWAAHGSPNVELIWPFLEKIGLDVVRAKNDMQSKDIQDIVNTEMQDVNTLQIAQTPTFFLNGRLISLKSIEDFEATITNQFKENAEK